MAITNHDRVGNALETANSTPQRRPSLPQSNLSSKFRFLSDRCNGAFTLLRSARNIHPLGGGRIKLISTNGTPEKTSRMNLCKYEDVRLLSVELLSVRLLVFDL